MTETSNENASGTLDEFQTYFTKLWDKLEHDQPALLESMMRRGVENLTERMPVNFFPPFSEVWENRLYKDRLKTVVFTTLVNEAVQLIANDHPLPTLLVEYGKAYAANEEEVAAKKLERITEYIQEELDLDAEMKQFIARVNDEHYHYALRFASFFFINVKIAKGEPEKLEEPEPEAK